MTIQLHQGDIPSNIRFTGSVAVDTETLGLNPLRDRLCVVQLSAGDGDCHIVQLDQGAYDAANLKALFADRGCTKLFHFARFDLAVLRHYLGVDCGPVYCTKIASNLTRTYTDKHGLKDLCAELLGVEINKQQQQSDWGAETLTEAQLAYAANDVLYLHRLKEVLDRRLVREERTAIAKACFEFLPAQAELDLIGWADKNIFAH